MSKRTTKKVASKRRGSVLSALGLALGLLGSLFAWNKLSGRNQKKPAESTPSSASSPKPSSAPRVAEGI